jgi:cell fate (sporulation/competence/biofilm development) regulator YlbF (YheA/YmcA/DUF963 family)
MNISPILDLPTAHEKVDKAATRLGDLLREQPLYQTYLQAIMDLEKDPQVRDLSSQIQMKRNSLHGGKGNAELSAELQRLNLELEALPAVQAYRVAENEVRALFGSVNTLLSELLKVDFAANAKRGCGCGG